MTSRLAGLWNNCPLAFWLLLCALLYFAWMAIRLSIVDIRKHVLPNRIVLPSYAVAGVLLAASALAASDSAAAGRAAGGAAVLWVGYGALRMVYPPGMGRGDVKLAGVLGLYLGTLGWEYLLWGTLAGFLLGGLWGAGLILSRRGTGASRIPFGPFMLAGTAVTMLAASG